MEEEVFCSSCVDESETLVRQFLDTTFSHLYFFCVKCVDVAQLAICRLVSVDWLTQVYAVTVPKANGAVVPVLAPIARLQHLRQRVKQ